MPHALEVSEPLPSLTVRHRDRSSLILGGEVTLVQITEEDAQHLGRDHADLAQECRDIIQEALASYRQSYSFDTLLRGIAFASLATLALLLVAKGIRRGGRWLAGKLDEVGREKIPLAEVPLAGAARLRSDRSGAFGLGSPVGRSTRYIAFRDGNAPATAASGVLGTGGKTGRSGSLFPPGRGSEGG